jgi:drug/metabolite transporter (DMT)-like permease
MFWFIFAISSAFFHALYFALTKKFLKNINQFVLASGAFFITSIILFLISLINGIPEIAGLFYVSVLATTILNIFIVILNYKALQITDLSLCIPILSFTPVFLIFTSFVLLGELPTILGVVGILLIVVGSYILNIKGGNIGFLTPFKNIFRNKGIMLMLAASFFMSVSTNFDKLVVVNSDPIFGSSIVYFLLAVSFLIISSAKKYEIKDVMKANFHKFFLIALVIVLTAILINLTYTLQIVPYVISIKRFSVLFSVLLGALFFKEKNIPKRLLGALIMLIGAVIIILF